VQNVDAIEVNSKLIYHFITQKIGDGFNQGAQIGRIFTHGAIVNLGQKKHPKCYILVDLFTNSSGHPGINYG
jgi:hypothetical protein